MRAQPADSGGQQLEGKYIGIYEGREEGGQGERESRMEGVMERETEGGGRRGKEQ